MYTIIKLIQLRRSRLNKISGDVLLQEMKQLIWDGEFLFTPLSKVDERAVKDNNATDRKLIKKFSELSN
jgi:hypothetical protein